MTSQPATAPTLAAAASGAPAQAEGAGVLARSEAVGAAARAGTVGVPAQIETVGGAAPTAVAAILVFLVAVALSVVVTYRYARGYLRTRQRPLLVLTAGMLLLAPAPMFIRLVLGNVAVVTGTERTLVVTVSRLCGLLAILSVVHPR